MKFKVFLTNFIILLVVLGNFCLAKTKYDEKPNILKNQSQKSFIKKELFKKDWILRKDIHVFSKPVNQLVQANIYQNDKKIRMTFVLLKKSNVKSIKCKLSFDPMYFFVMGNPVLINEKTKEIRKIDYEFKNERVIFDEVIVNNRLKYIEFTVASRKLKNIGKLTIEDKIKQARTIRRIKQQLDSWSPLAANQIIAQPTLRPIISHGGYAVAGVKRAVIWANNTKITGKFELIDALINVQHPDPQPVVYTGDLIETGNHIWGGNNYIADFSDFKKKGLYFVRLKVNETNEISDSYVFPIKKDIYLELAKKASKWFYYQRCGIEVPGFHKECHMQDAVIKLDGTKVDVTGGWHDAGDYGKWIGGGTSGVLALTIFQDEFENEFKRSSEVPELTDEAAWEARYFCKGYWDGVFHPGFTGNFENVCEWLGAPECEPPRIVLEEEMIENNYGPVKSPGISLTGASLAIVARQIKSYDKEFAKKCITIAKDAYNIDSKVELGKSKLNSFLGLQTGLLLSDVELFKITNDKKYKEDAKIRVKNITKQQIEGREGFFHYDEAKKTERYADCRFQMLALYEYYKTFPESELNKEIKNTFKRWADYMMKYGNVSSFGLIGGVTKDGTIKSYRYVAGANRRIGAVAWGLATAAIILDEPKYLEAAELQLQWIIGFNPADISMMATVGKGPGCYHHRYSFMEGCEDGIVPGGILNGIMPGNGEIIEIGDITKNFIIAKLPPEYPIIDTGVWGWTFAYLTNEYWTRNNSWFVLGAMQIEKAMRELN
jgi:endoglucanase